MREIGRIRLIKLIRLITRMMGGAGEMNFAPTLMTRPTDGEAVFAVVIIDDEEPRHNCKSLGSKPN
jgi:hypothetical protein